MIAVMIAAAMCVVPLFVIEDSEAITVTAGDKAVSFKAGSITDEKFDGLVTQDYKNQLAEKVIDSIVVKNGYSSNWEFVGNATVKNVKDVKLSLGNSVSDSSLKNISASAIKFDLEMTIKCKSTTGILFNMSDGTQTLFKELGTNKVAQNDQLTINGTVVLEDYTYLESSIVKNTAENYVVKEMTVKNSTSVSFDGKIKVVALDKTYELKTKKATGAEAISTPDYYNADKIEDVTETSKVILNVKIGSGGGVETSFNYKINDKSGGYDSIVDTRALMEMIGSGGAYQAGTVAEIEAETGETLLYTVNLAPTPVSYYDPSGTWMEDCFFSYGMVSIADPTNEKVKTYLDDIGDISDSYSDAKSVADGAYTSVSTGGSGNNNIVFYVIIGVLAVAVVALAVLMIKKK